MGRCSGAKAVLGIQCAHLERKRKSSEGKYNVLTSKTAGKENIMCLSVKILFLKGRMCSLG